MPRPLSGRGLLAAALIACAGSLLGPPPAGADGTAPTATAATATTTAPTAENGRILFRSGTAGYGCFRIPTIVKTKAGSLLAFTEARTSPSCADRGDVDIVLRRSTDDGRTWGPIRVATSGSENDPNAPHTRGNPSPVVDINGDGRISLLSTGEPAVFPPGEPRKAYAQNSTDDGLTFSPPRQITRLRGMNSTGWFGTGPAHGIQLSTGPHADRLVVGAYEDGPGGRLAGYLYSDNGGINWHARPTDVTPETPTMKPGEPAVAELSGGRVYIGARNEKTQDTEEIAQPNLRTYGIAPADDTAIPAQAFTANLKTPSVQASVLTLHHTSVPQTPNLMILAAPTGTPAGASGPDQPARPNDRANLKIHYSLDEGKTWTAGTTIKSGPAGYSDLAELDNGRVALVHEGGNPGSPPRAEGEWSSANIYFRNLDPRELGLPANTVFPTVPAFTPTPDAPTTPDASPQANDAHYAGNATLGAGRFGQRGLQLDGTGDFAHVPYGRSLNPGDLDDPDDPGGGNFTYSLHFQHNAAADAEPAMLLWAYGVGTAPQVWIRAEPKGDRILAHVQGKDGTAEVSVPGEAAFSGEAWNHLTLVRDGTKIRLQVNGITSTTQVGEVRGAVTKPSFEANQGVAVGGRVGDGYRSFKGGIDEVRLYLDDLNDTQIGELRDNNSETARESLVLRLPFQVEDQADTAALTSVSIADDVSGKCVDGTVLGGVSADNRVKGKTDLGALAVDATHPGVETPFRRALDVGSGDFSYALWFKNTPTSNSSESNEVLLWAYGVDPDGTGTAKAPSLGARIEPGPGPGANRILAWAETSQGRVERQIDGAPGLHDTNWHLLTLTRTADGFSLGIDRTVTPPAPLSGKFELADGTTPLGLRVGSQPGGGDPLTGVIDDVRLYARALTATDLKGLVPDPGGKYTAPAEDDVRFKWSMEHGNVQKHSVIRPASTGRSTPDESAHCNNAYVHGGTYRPDGGRFGQAFRVNGLPGKDGKVELPYTDSEAFGAGDFTVATVFSHDPDTSAKQSIVWAYGDGDAERQLRIRVEARTEQVNGVKVTKRKLVGFVQTDAGPTEVATDAPGAGWHHVALTRKGNELRLYLDGQEKQLNRVTGSLTRPDSFDVQGFVLGDSPAGGQPLKGSLDEFRLYRQAIDGPGLTALWNTNTAPAQYKDKEAVHLPLDVIENGEYSRM
ncbi:neuraminidase [Streptomyces venezuelae]|uniref:exo-alpha-sialidase n=1 Tax=Streptomyces venezuelae TaxID=54571 RepID=A0A5P2D6L4_STRVZ|nr:LamG-like jellyroll fold domain-containing protein [Streptomyces venezuelae]QES50805.1 neuraminidase [Streptomyces venezuelae]